MERKLNNVQIVEKGEMPRFQDKEVYENSSDIIVYNLFEQTWENVQAEGLAHLFKNEADFNRKKTEHTLKGGE